MADDKSDDRRRADDLRQERLQMRDQLSREQREQIEESERRNPYR